MSSTIWKHFYLCFSNLKFALPTCTTTTTTTPSSNHDDSQNQFNSSFQYEYSTTSKSLSSSTNDVVDFFFSSPDHHCDDGSASPPDLTTVLASQRFFFSSPGRSNSIFEPLEPALIPAEASGGIAVRTYSPDPFSDFRRSMQEMVEARDLTDADANWDFLHELLLCYLTLNPKHTHKYIVSAFSDLLISLMPSTSRRKIDQSRPISQLLQRRPLMHE